MSGTLRGMLAARVFLCFALGYLLSYGLRSINAVIAPALMQEMAMSNADMGLLSSAYFVAFGSLQLPLGIWLDKYGPRRTEAALLVVAAIGAMVFALSDSLVGLWIGRALIGIGVSACLMAAFKAYRLWFAPEQQSQLASWMLVAGTAGALTATVPVTLALPEIGWRGIFWVVAALLMMVSAAIFLSLRGVERHFATAPANASAGADDDGGYRRIFNRPYFRRMASLGMFNQGVFVALQTLWAGPWMTTVLGKSQQETSEILFMLNLVLMMAYLALGWAAPRLMARGVDPHRLIAAGIIGMVVAQTAMLFTQSEHAWILWLVLALCVPVTTLVQSYLALSFPAALAGRANSAYNLMLFVGAFATQWGFGVVADGLKASGMNAVDAFRLTLAAAVVLQTGSLVYFVGSKAKAHN